MRPAARLLPSCGAHSDGHSSPHSQMEKKMARPVSRMASPISLYRVCGGTEAGL